MTTKSATKKCERARNVSHMFCYFVRQGFDKNLYPQAFCQSPAYTIFAFLMLNTMS